MNIIQENIDDVNAILKVKVAEEDYLPKVEITLKDYQKKASIPGFRPGKVPAGVIKKRFFKSVMVDEINRLLTDSLNSYLSENKINVLGNPLPKRDENLIIDWDNQKEFEFTYEMGLAPEFSVELSSKDKFTYATVRVDEDLISKYVTDIAKRYGKVEEAETTQEGDLTNGDFVELDAAGEILPGGIFNSSSLFLDKVKDAGTKKALLGLKKGDKAILDAQLITDTRTDLVSILNITKDRAESIACKVQYTIKSITRLNPAEVNQEFFDKLYGAGVINSVDELRAKVKDELSVMFVNDSDRKLYNDVVEHLMNKINFNLPTEFMKRWLLTMNEKTVNAEQLDAEFGDYQKAMKWQLIESKIVKDHNIQVSNDELIEDVKTLILQQYGQAGFNPSEEELNDTAKRVLKNEEETKKIAEKLFGQKVMELFKSTFTLENKEMSYDDFFKSNK